MKLIMKPCFVNIIRNTYLEEKIESEKTLPLEDDKTGDDEVVEEYVVSPTSGILKLFQRKDGENDLIIENLKPTSKSGHSQKKHFCFYCQKKMVKIYRHYLTVHKEEKDAIKIISASTNKDQKRYLMNLLRKKGDDLHNSKKSHEEDVVCRISKKTNVKYVTCPRCFGKYTKFNVRHHLSRCQPSAHSQRRNVQAEVNKIDKDIHPLASKDLRERVFANLRDDQVKNLLRYDEAIILFGNYQCLKYTSYHHGTLIRSHLRCLGKLLQAAQQLDPAVSNLTCLLDVSKGNLIINCIDKVARIKFNNTYEAPSTAICLSNLLKQVCRVLEIEYMQVKDDFNEKKMRKVAKFLEVRFRVTVNKKSSSTQKINSRRKKVKLPKTQAIAQFRIFLEKCIKTCLTDLKNEFTVRNWTLLAQYTLVHLTVFNRKRPGECQRIEIEDFRHHEILDTDDELMVIEGDAQEQIRKYARITFTGKLGRNNALLVDRQMGIEALKMIIKHREQAGVPKDNPFLFGMPSKKSNQDTFETCSLIRKFSYESGIENAELLRTRLLRQHIATKTAASNVDNRLESRLSDFMSHQKQIHKDYYALTQKQDDISKVSKLLEDFSSVPSSSTTNSVSANDLTETSEDEFYDPRKEKEYETSNSSIASENIQLRPTEKELNVILGKKQSRRLWSSDEKKAARFFFDEEITKGKPLDLQKVKKFLNENRTLFKYRTPNLVYQWVIYQCKNLKKKTKLGGKRRWSTPEKEAVNTSIESYATENSLPSLNDVELLKERNPILNTRTTESIKTFMCLKIKKRRLSL